MTAQEDQGSRKGEEGNPNRPGKSDKCPSGASRVQRADVTAARSASSEEAAEFQVPGSCCPVPSTESAGRAGDDYLPTSRRQKAGRC